MTTVRVFIASPGDVALERRIAAGIVSRLTDDYAEHLNLELTFWEDEPLLASADFQSQIGTPASADIFVALMWSRLGSPLGPQYVRKDGSRYASATEYEFEEAMAGFQATGKPHMLVYRKTAPMAADADSAQVAAVEQFFDRWFLNPDATSKGAYHTFTDPERFEDTFEVHLRRLLSAYVPPPNNLPVATTRFIGREELTSRLAELLLDDELRLLTLVGPGGAGKTRLSLQVAHQCLWDFSDGVYFISLASLTDPEMVPVAIADALDIRETAKLTVVDNIIQEIRRKHMLFVVDNLEQVQVGGRYLGTILSQCAGVKIMVTSREALRLKGARTIMVPPMSLPDAKTLPSVAELRSCESVRLFVERAQAAREDFELTPDNAAAVTAICRKVDALPLAIELAASRIRSMQPERLLSALEERFRVLTSGAADLLDHQRSLRELIAWSYELLDQREQQLWRRLAVFSDGCTTDAAQRVCDPHDEYFVEIDVESLIDKSLLSLSSAPAAGVAPRLTMLSTLREYAYDQLVSSDEYNLLQQRFREWCIDIAEEGKISAGGAVRDDWMNLIDDEDNNLRQALESARASGEPDDLRFGVRLTGALWFYWYDRGIFGEAVNWLQWAVDSDYREPDQWRGRALAGFAGVLRQQNKLDDAAHYAQEALKVFTGLNDEIGRAEALGELGAIAQRVNDNDQAQIYLDQALALARDQPGNLRKLSFLLTTRGVVDHLRGDLDAAKANYEQALAIGRDIGDANDIATALVNLGEIAELEGDLASALDCCRESMRLFGAVRMKLAVAYCAEVLAGLETRVSNKPSEAAFLFGAADALREELEAPIEPFNAERLQRDLEATQNALSAEEFTTAWEAGRGLGMDGALRRA